MRAHGDQHGSTETSGHGVGRGSSIVETSGLRIWSLIIHCAGSWVSTDHGALRGQTDIDINGCSQRPTGTHRDQRGPLRLTVTHSGQRVPTETNGVRLRPTPTAHGDRRRPTETSGPRIWSQAHGGPRPRRTTGSPLTPTGTHRDQRGPMETNGDSWRRRIWSQIIHCAYELMGIHEDLRGDKETNGVHRDQRGPTETSGGPRSQRGLTKRCGPRTWSLILHGPNELMGIHRDLRGTETNESPRPTEIGGGPRKPWPADLVADHLLCHQLAKARRRPRTPTQTARSPL